MRERDAGQGSEGTIDRPVVVFGGGCVLHGRLCCSLARSLAPVSLLGGLAGRLGWLVARSLARPLAGFCLFVRLCAAGRQDRKMDTRHGTWVSGRPPAATRGPRPPAVPRLDVCRGQAMGNSSSGSCGSIGNRVEVGKSTCVLSCLMVTHVRRRQYTSILMPFLDSIACDESRVSN